MSAATFESLNPSTGEVIETFPRSGAAEVDRAVDTAREAFESWRLVPAPERGNILFRFAQVLEAHKPELSELMTREMGKVKAEAGGDVQEAIDMSYYMGGEGRRLFGHTTPSELRDKFMMSVRMPVGVVGAITPWNFPIAIPAWKLTPALVCGNTVVLKPAEDTPLLAQRFVDLLHEAGLPEGVVQIVHGFGEEAGEALVRHPDVPIITFTGSRETGVIVTKSAADELKHVHLELGGKNAIIVLDDADVDLAVDGIVWSAFGTAGQRCTAASRVIVQRGVYEELKRKLVARAERMKIGAPWEDDTEIGPVINETAVEKIHSYTGIGRDEGAQLLTGGERVEGHGFYYRPTVFADVDAQMRIAQEEIFGPTTALIPVDSFEEAVARFEQRALRAVLVDLYARRQQGVCRDARPADRDHLHQRGHDRRRGALAVRRHQADGQRAPRGGSGGARRLHGVEVGLRRLQRQAPARADRQQLASLPWRRCSSPTAARAGTPGPAAYGFVLEAEDGTVLDARGEAIGVATNNVAEYSGLIAGLRRALELGVPEVEVVSDSELMVKQMRGEYRVKNGALRELSVEAAPSRARAGAGRVPPRASRARTSSPTGSSTRLWTRPSDHSASVSGCRRGR